MMARKLLMKHMSEQKSEQKHEIELLIDTLKSNLFFHGHPINRREAKEDLKLKVTFADGPLADVMWALYCAYEDELKLTSPFSPQRELETQLPQPPALNKRPEPVGYYFARKMASWWCRNFLWLRFPDPR
jgi:hypothetical protein